jgi:hypothetical protein
VYETGHYPMHFTEDTIISLKKHNLEGEKKVRMQLGCWVIISERLSDIDEELCACYIESQKAFDSENWTKLMKILEINSIDWRKED